MSRTLGPSLIALATALLGASPLAAQQTAITPPTTFFTQPVGSDYFLADYPAYEAYLKKLATESDRIKLIDIGKTSENRTMWVAIVSSPANLAKLDHYKEIARRLARAEGLTPDQARALATEGKAVVWIDAGLHASETVNTQGQIQVLYRMLSQNDPETLRILDDEIVLFGQDNPDGLDLVAHWYMREKDPKKRDLATIPTLFQKYIGHDNNRDSFMMAMPETTNVNRQLFREWYPQIVYNQHQTGPDGMVVFVPPFRDPFNFNYDPIVMSELDEVGAAMHSGLIAEGKAGSGMRSAARYSTWHNGMERSVAYFHNSIGLLTEIIGSPTPTTVPLVPSTQLPRGDEKLPIRPQEWHLQQSLDYQWTMDRAVMDYAVRNRERLLFNIYQMGANSIARGNTDSWTVTPRRVAELEAAPAKVEASTDGLGQPRVGPKRVDPALYDKIMRAPQNRDPRGYIISADQPDFPTATAFANALIKNGVDVARATKAFTVAGKSYPAGSLVVKTAQAYRPHVLDMFEPQNHPHDTDFPGGPPKAPYDITGYTLAYQMGVRFDRVLEGFDGPFEAVPDVMTPPAGQIVGEGGAGWIVSHQTNNSFILTNRLLAAGIRPSWIAGETKVGSAALGTGAIWIPASSPAAAIVQRAARELGITAYARQAEPSGSTTPLRPMRIGLVDRWGGSIPSGWTRWLLEQYEFPYKLVFPKQLDAGNLQRDFDVLIFANGILPAAENGPWKVERPSKQPELKDTPSDLHDRLGKVTDEKTLPAITAFAQAGGTVVAIGSSTRLAETMKTPLTPTLLTKKDGKEVKLDTKTFYIPGSVLRVRIDNRQPLAYGMPDQVDVFFDSNQSFVLPTGGAVTGVSKVAWYDSANPLRSGWAIGEGKLVNTIAVADVDVGKGKLLVLGPEVIQRAQSYGTFKLLFNGLLYGPANRAGGE